MFSTKRDVDRSADTEPTEAYDTSLARQRFGGLNAGAAFFGWLVAMAVAILLTSIVGAVAAALGSSANITQSQAQRQAGTIGLTAAVVLVVILLVAYYTGGYVAGRMSRFDGGRQGAWVWVLGVMAAAAAIGVALLLGPQVDLADRVSLPASIPPPLRQVAGPAAAVVTLLCSLLVTIAGGKVGCRYHRKVDQAA